ncbi:MAG: hypothetical protein IKB01_00635 [Lachnospiraceae bacterium]|nr:hypothetical protein [Lachnospiraceae bacterium]
MEQNNEIKDLRYIESPKSLVAWLNNNDLLIRITFKEAGILLSNLKKHGYSMAISGQNKICLVDTSKVNDVKEFTIDEIIDSVCEWNYEAVQVANKQRKKAADFIDFCNKQSEYERLKEDEKVLDRMFERTIYGKIYGNRIIQMTEKMLETNKEAEKMNA